MPPSARASASPTLAQVMPTAPASSCRRAISTHLCVLACGRSFAGPPAAKSAMRWMLRMSFALSSTSAGVSTSL